MNDTRIEQSLRNLDAAINRLREAVEEPGGDALKPDAAIHRFEFVIELFWKTLKRLLAAEHIQTTTPEEAMQQAFKAGWLESEDLWLGMLKDRNETSHIYNEQMARRVYERILVYLPEIEKTGRRLAERFRR